MRPEKWVVKCASGGALMTRKQLPLRLAWAFSIHKSQGMTLDSVEISLARVFECGQGTMKHKLAVFEISKCTGSPIWS